MARQRDPYGVPDFETTSPRRRQARRRRRIKWVASTVGIIVGTAVILGLATAAWLNSSLGNISRVDVQIPEESRAPDNTTESTNILLLGADAGTARNGEGSSIIRDAASDSWPAGKYRSDATMLLHIPADRSHVYVISIPRDSYVPVYSELGQPVNSNKINAALSLFGPSGALSTVENLVGVRLDHVAMLDWDGFEAITNSLGGVTLQEGSDEPREYDGAEALAYVRDRSSVPNGDFDRVKRQQNFLRATAASVLSAGTLVNPIKLKNTLDSVTSNMAVDEGWSTGDIRGLAFSLRALRTDDMTFMTVPTNGTASDPTAGSIVVLDDAACGELFEAIRTDTMAAWIAANPDAALGGYVP